MKINLGKLGFPIFCSYIDINNKNKSHECISSIKEKKQISY